MIHYPICTTCGVQYASSKETPESCSICEDERQYVNANGQTWTSLEQVKQQHKNIIKQVASNLYAIYTKPSFAIAQRAHLLTTPHGNILWDCITNLDVPTIDTIRQLGGIKAIAISHPHYYSTMVEWSRAFGNVPVYLHQLDAEWLGRNDPAVRFWTGQEQLLWEGVKLVHCGGHFAGASILYDPAGKGSLLVGDVIQVCPDRKTVSFMYSYPNYIPLSAKEVKRIQEVVKPLSYDAMYGAFGHYILSGARQAMEFSVNRYLDRIR